MRIIKYTDVFIINEGVLTNLINTAWRKIKNISNKNSISTLDYINSLDDPKDKDEAFKQSALNYEVNKGLIRLQELLEMNDIPEINLLIDKIILSLAQTKNYSNANTLLQQLKIIKNEVNGKKTK